jgi:hypothetical protein
MPPSSRSSAELANRRMASQWVPLATKANRLPLRAYECSI